jgi:hypothetical protein
MVVVVDPEGADGRKVKSTGRVRGQRLGSWVWVGASSSILFPRRESQLSLAKKEI